MVKRFDSDFGRRASRAPVVYRRLLHGCPTPFDNLVTNRDGSLNVGSFGHLGRYYNPVTSLLEKGEWKGMRNTAQLRREQGEPVPVNKVECLLSWLLLGANLVRLGFGV